MSAPADGELARPALRVVRGDPTPEELAALTALLAATSESSGGARSRVRRGGWNDPGWQHVSAPLPGPNAWRASAFPH
jgi:hypothetical protein